MKKTIDVISKMVHRVWDSKAFFNLIMFACLMILVSFVGIILTDIVWFEISGIVSVCFLLAVGIIGSFVY